MMFLESKRLSLVILALAVGSFVFYGVANAGCGSSSGAGSCSGHDASHQHDADKSHDHGKTQDSNRPQDSNKPQDSNIASQEQPKAVEQTTCPVMGGAINKELFTTYKDKKVYFCCPSCKGKFENDPGKYIGKLPQFGKK